MASAARCLDMIDVAPAFTAEDAAAMEARFAGVSTQDMLRDLLGGELKGRIAAVSSFGTESAVLLHMVAQVDQDVPVIFTNTQKMFGETLEYRDELSERLGLTDLRVFRPDPRLLAAKDANGLRWSYDPDGCCDLRKVEPLRRALLPFDAWISGRKGFQSATRAALPRFEVDDGRLKLNPL
ncbi:phosphoadenylyl-sulfate reductase, partial [uncultured Sphingomonas sp.]